MRSHDRHMILRYVEKMGKISAYYGVAYNQELKSKHFHEKMNEFIAGTLTLEDIEKFLKEPFPWEKDSA